MSREIPHTTQRTLHCTVPTQIKRKTKMSEGSNVYSLTVRNVGKVDKIILCKLLSRRSASV